MMKNQPIIQGEEILRLIPQRQPIVMVDRFFGIKNHNSYTGFTIKEDNIFLYRDHFSEPGLIEHVAQSVAARNGYICQQKMIPVPIGFIGSVDKMYIYALPSINDELLTEVKIIQQVDVITLIGATVKSGDKIITECRMKIFLNKTNN